MPDGEKESLFVTHADAPCLSWRAGNKKEPIRGVPNTRIGTVRIGSHKDQAFSASMTQRMRCWSISAGTVQSAPRMKGVPSISASTAPTAD